MTITEGLAELKTIQKRIVKKREFIASYTHRQEGLKDPLEKQGGSIKLIAQERQAIDDLIKRAIRIRTEIQRSNLATPLTVQGRTAMIAEWLAWRKDHAALEQSFLATIRTTIQSARAEAAKRGFGVAMASSQEDRKPTDVLINVDEQELAQSGEKLEVILSELDGQLSLLCATTQLAME